MLIFVFLSIDSFVASVALGMLGLTASRRRALCVAFGMCDGLATFLGLHLHLTVSTILHIPDPLRVAGMLCAWMLFVAFLVGRIVVGKRLGLVEISLLPIVLGIDNLFAGVELAGWASWGPMAPLFAGLVSATFALAGYELGTVAADRMPRRWVLGVGSGLLLLIPVIT